MTPIARSAVAANAVCYISRDAQVFGPYSPEELRQLCRDGAFTLYDHACIEGGEWIAMHKLLGVPAPPIQAQPQPVHRVQISGMPTVKVQRTFNGIKALGALLIFASVPSCIVGTNLRAGSSGMETAMSIGTGMFFLGFILFVIGRFKD
jgi:hypothetical protein